MLCSKPNNKKTKSAKNRMPESRLLQQQATKSDTKTSNTNLQQGTNANP
jgi:hypothetical protein